MRFVLVVALLSSTAFADARRDRQVKAVHAAIKTSPAAVAKLIQAFPISVDGLPFGDPMCDAKFGRTLHVEQSELAALVECLKGEKLGLAGDMLIAEPGIEIDVHFDLGKVTGFTSDGVVRAPHAAKHLAATASIAPLAATKAAMGKARVPFLAVDIALCVGADGAVTSATIERYSPVVAGAWADDILAATKAATYAPFTRGGHALPVCTHQLHVYPAAKRTVGLAELARLESNEGVEGGEVGGVIGGDLGGIGDMTASRPPPPPPPAPPQNLPPMMFESHRIAGTKLIAPDDRTKAEIKTSGKDKVIGSFKLCIDERGSITAITMLKSTGFPAYDTTLMRGMRAWKFRPFDDGGTAVPVCTAFTFIYTET